MTNKITSIIVLVFLAAAGLYFFVNSQEKAISDLPRENCTETTEKELTLILIGQGSEIIRENGKVFICDKQEEQKNEEPETPQTQEPVQTYKDLIKITTPTSNENVSSPIYISGEARGSWFFEASFPITLLDSKGDQIGQTIATAQKDWMTSDFVPFTAQITITQNYTGPATIVFQKDNPSGLPENNDEFRLPVTLK